MTDVDQILATFFHRKSDGLIVTENVLGYTLGVFFSQTHLVTLFVVSFGLFFSFL
jgi:hypothetical protein